MVRDISAKMFSHQTAQRGKACSDSHSRPSMRLGGHGGDTEVAGLWDKAGQEQMAQGNIHLHRSGMKRQQFRAVQTEETSKIFEAEQ